MWRRDVMLGVVGVVCGLYFFFQAEDGIRDVERSRGLGDVYKRQVHPIPTPDGPVRAQGITMQTLSPGVTVTDTPKPPYYAVIFTSVRTATTLGYDETAARMLELAADMPGFLGVESAREEIGITVSYWKTLDAIRAWQRHPEHRAAQQRGRKDWYVSFTTRVCLVERENHFPPLHA
eukprot:TRINITY_DN7657_c0_g4_i1.p2 TRINITY_DN7657_c0_g4~~TRINITY_DN7657_c0_g4_i1.p2  ORF type:complete len:177 (-),score=34.40 TRINITY_DN7657_c0_g4_i1:408-938(-)